MAKDILKEAIADAKAVREVALANAKAALEEAFTPKLQSMLSAKLSEELDEEYDEDEKSEGMYYDEDEDMDEGMSYDEDEDMDEMMNYDEDGDVDEGMDYDEDESMEEEADLDEEIDLEEILNELELEEDEEVLDEEEELEEVVGYPNYRADQITKVKHDADDINQGLNESEEFDLDALLNEINSLDENNLEEGHCYDEDGKPMPEAHCMEEGKKEDLDEGKLKDTFMKIFNNPVVKKLFPEEYYGEDGKFLLKKFMEDLGDAASSATAVGTSEGVEEELEETKAALDTVKTELNEVNLLNSKLLYVNRIFKANNLDEAQKLRVVETLDKADSVKEAKLIYETIKDTFNVAKSKKASFKSKTKSLQEGIGMASKAAGTSTAPKKEIISESNGMMTRFQKLANIKINE